MENLSLKPRVKKMDGVEKKSGSRKRLTSVGFHSDDDEPIGSMFKLKSKRNSKKLKVGFDGGSDKGKEIDVRGEKMLVGNEDEDLGGMDDTLASFRKKLRGPKKDAGSAIMMGRNMDTNGAEPSGQCLDAPVDNGDLAVESISRIVGTAQVIDHGGDDRNIDDEIESKGKGNIKRFKIASTRKKNGSNTDLDEDLNGRRSGDNSRQNQEENVLGSGVRSDQCLDENLEDSLSEFFRKAQSGLIRKSRSSSRSKQTRESQVPKDRLSPSSDDFSEEFPVFVNRAHCASRLAQKVLKSEDNLQQLSGRSAIDLVHDLNKSGMHHSSDVNLCHSGCMEEDLLRSEPREQLASAEIMGSSDNKYGKYSEGVLEDSVPISLVQMPQSCLSTCSNKTAILQDGEVDNKPASGIQEGPSVDLCGSDRLCDGEPTLEIRNYEDGLKNCLRKASDLLHDDDVDITGKIVSAKTTSQNSSPCNEKKEAVSKFEGELDSCQHQKDFQQHDSDYAIKEESCCYDTSNQIRGTCIEEPDLASVSSQKDDMSISDSRLSPLISLGHKSEFSFQMNHREKSPEAGDKCDSYLQELCQNESTTSIQKRSSSFHQDQTAGDASKGVHIPSQDYFFGGEDGNEESSPSTMPDRNEDGGSMHDPENKNNKQLAVQRAPRNAKKCRHGDMAYEGDVDWEVLIHEQGFLESHQVGDSDQFFKTREKLHSSSASVVDSENGGAAAVSAGLKARAAGPVEKIKFKEVLKHKGGLQEYLECRNQILGLWSKDVSRILPLTDCGVTATPSLNEPPRTSLIREIYAFLDYSGYINTGVAFEKERAEPGAKNNLKFTEEKILGEKSGAPVSDSDDGVSFILGGAKNSDASLETKNGIIFDDANLVAGATRDGKLVTVQTAELYTKMEPEEFQSSCRENGFIDAKLTNGILHLDISSSDLSKEVFIGGVVPAITREFTKQGDDVQYSSIDCMEGNHQVQCDSDVRNRVIVIGAGPAGLTAARHLQRQGFSVNVLEARSRIGGRVYTDRSSLSVPVDLGASIITGVEADVATERRPDPSSLICSQLGLELTVLNSDCPLYDIVTCQKVPAELDEALEAEYNSLLDDMVLLVAQKGEQVMKMSLEDGLEYALKRRRMARLGRKFVDDLHTSQDILIDESISDGKVLENNDSEEEILSPLERRVMDWHFANLEYGCAALLKKVSLPYWNQDDVYGGFGGAHCMIKGGYSTVVESLGEGLCIHLNHMVTDVSYHTEDVGVNDDIGHKVTVSTSNGREFSGDAVLITVPLGCLKAETIKFSPRLPQWKHMSIQRLGFGVLNKVVLEFPEVFWDDSVDYFGATAEETNQRGQCFMFWNVKKTVGAPVLIALLVGKAAIDGQNMSLSDHVNHALMVLRKLFGEATVPDPIGSVVTDWGRDPFSYGAYSYVAVGASGEDYDILGRPVDNCLFFAGEATCKEHPDTVGGAMMSGLREAVRIVNILRTGNDYTAEVEAMEAAQRHSDSERNEVRDIMKRLEAVEFSNVLYKNSLDGTRILTREALLQDMFFNAKTIAGRLHLAKELLNLPVEALKSFAGTKEGLSTLNSWILDSLGKDGTQLLRHCVRLLVLISTDLLAVRLSGIGKTVKEKVCVHTSRDIRAIASQLVSVWIEVFRKEKASNGGLKLRKQSIAVDASKSRSNSTSGKAASRVHHGTPDNKGKLQVSAYAGSHLPRSASTKMVNFKPAKLDARADMKLEVKSSKSQGSVGGEYAKGEEDQNFAMSEEEQAAFAAAEAARAAAHAAAEAYASSEAKCNTLLQLPKIPSFHKFARREQYAQMEESDVRRKWSGGAFGRQDCLSEIDSRNCRVRDWSVDFSAACVNLDSSKLSVDNLSQRSHSNEIACHLNFREHSGESVAVDSSIFTKAWVDAAGSVGIKDHTAIERWQSQAAAADSDFYSRTMHLRDEEYSNTNPRVPIQRHKGLANESSVSQVTINKELVQNQPKGAELIKRAVVDYVASLLMPLYKARKIDKEGYKSIMKKTATKVMEQTTDAEKAMAVYEFLDFKRKNKIRSFVDKLIEIHMAMKPVAKT